MRKSILAVLVAFGITFVMIAETAHYWASAKSGVAGEGAVEATSKTSTGSLEGSWTVDVTIRNCANGAAIRSFPAMNTFHRGGTMNEFSVGNAPLARGPGHGVWQQTGDGQYYYAFQLFRFNADGSYAGIAVARRYVQLDFVGSSYTATANIEIYGTNGALISTGCASETATRFS